VNNSSRIDYPTRMGDRRILRVEAGQSTVAADAGLVELGLSTENEWWGPGIRNALILSNNAPGFPRIFVRSARPIATQIGAFEGRWLIGGLSESPFFDDNPDNDLRSVSILGLTWRPRWDPDLTLGVTRAVFATARDWGSVLGDFWQVFADVGAPNAYSYADQTSRPPGGRDQLFSLFFRWVFPGYGFETYAEWARAEQPRSLRDLLIEPNHSQAYTLGLQWVGQPVVLGGRLRVEAEASYLEMSTTGRYRPQGTWYTSRAALQGYTHLGQTLGAAIGPGSSSQSLGVHYIAPRWQAGIFGERIRWQNDVHSQRIDRDSGILVSWCQHDVTMRWGARVSGSNRLGTLGASYATGTRMNPFFVRIPFCPSGNLNDIRVRTLTVQFSPVSLRY
jgi:hypothetical protein